MKYINMIIGIVLGFFILFLGIIIVNVSNGAVPQTMEYSLVISFVLLGAFVGYTWKKSITSLILIGVVLIGLEILVSTALALGAK